MKALLSIGLVLCLGSFTGFTAGAYPGGGGGVELYTNMDAALLSGVGIPTAALVDLPQGSAYGVGGFGYGIDRHGWKIGGFGKAIFMGGPSLPLSMRNAQVVVNSVAGGIGGLISGGHGRIGPLDLSINCRLGVGGLAVSGWISRQGFAPYLSNIGIVALYGAADMEVGVHFFPAMMISAFAGIESLAPIAYGADLVIVPTPTMGIRLTWGSF